MIQWHKPPFVLKELKIEVTYKCDLNCIHCSSDAKPSNPLQVSRDDCIRIISEAIEIGVKNITFSGGEPLLWPYIFEVVEFTAKHNANTTIYTSGNVAEFQKKANSLHSLGATRFIFSLFGSIPTIHEHVTRISGSFDNTKSAIHVAQKIGLAIEIHFVPMVHNYRDFENLAECARQNFGNINISVLRLVPQGRATLLDNLILNRIQNLELRHQIKKLRKDGYKIRTGSPYNFLMLNDNPACFAAVDRLIIGPDMEIYPCDAFKRISAKELFGTEKFSSLSSSSLIDCWEKSPYLEAVRKYLTTDFSEPCNSCKLLSKCLSGCLAQKTIRNGGIAKLKDPDCLGSNFEM